MNQPVIVRAIRYPEEYAAVLTLWQNAGEGVHVGMSDTPEEIEKKLARDPDLFLVAEMGDDIVGSVLGGFDGRRGLIYHLAVRADLRQQGIGDSLMAEVEGRLREKGCRKVYLLVTRGNTHAMVFYEKRGWQEMDIHLFGKNLQD